MYQPHINHSQQFSNPSWEEAQPFCNFILFKPQIEKIIETSLRTESTTEFSSHRCLLQLSSALISIKQFLYDWAPPAYDHPSLWRNAKISPQEVTPIPSPLLVDTQIAWVGLNFRRQQAASLNVMRTMIEITVIEGQLKDEDFLEIFNTLKPTNSEIAEKIVRTPFAMLTSQWRHKKSASPVPLSYWKHTRKNQASHTAHLPHDFLHNNISNTLFNEYELNSIFVIEESGSLLEVEYYYEHQQYPGAFIRLLTIPRLPRLGDQFCYSEKRSLGKHTINYAYLTQGYGSHEAIWQENKRNYLLLVKPMKWTTQTWFLDHLKAFLN